MQTVLLLILGSLTIYSTVFAQDHFTNADFSSPECAFISAGSGSAQVQRNLLTSTKRGCSVKISTAGKIENSRSYTFDEGGVIQVFNQYGPREDGSRTYFIFPRTQKPTVEFLKPSGNLKVTTQSGDVIYFDTSVSPPQIKDDDSRTFHIEESATVSKYNKGGAELVQTAGGNHLILDCGFQMKAPAFIKPDRTSEFSDGNGNHCTLPNSALFVLSENKKDASFRFAKDKDLYAYLKHACSNLKLPEATAAHMRAPPRDLPEAVPTDAAHRGNN